jgi:hypothetical protein
LEKISGSLRPTVKIRQSHKPNIESKLNRRIKPFPNNRANKWPNPGCNNERIAATGGDTRLCFSVD